MKRQTRYLLGGAATAVAALLAVTVLLLRNDTVPGQASGHLALEQDIRDRQFSAGQESGTAAFGPGSGQDWSDPDTAEQRLEQYIAYAKYPDYSRPLRPGDTDLQDPYRPAGTKRPLFPAKCDENEDCLRAFENWDYHCTLIPESVMAIRQQDFGVSAECRNERTGEPVDLSGFQLNVILERNTNEGTRDIRRPGPIFFADDGTNGDLRAGDGIYRIVVRLGPDDWGWMRLNMEGEVDGIPTESSDAMWFSTPHRVAEFQAGVFDSERQGNLIVEVPVQIYKAGYYQFDANLLQVGEDRWPIANTYVNLQLSAGRHVVKFEFFGKVIRDRGLDGPYIVTMIRGRRNNTPVTPHDLRSALLENRLPKPRPEVATQPRFEYIPIAPDYETGFYHHGDFSDAEWVSEKKSERIRMLKRNIAEASDAL